MSTHKGTWVKMVTSRNMGKKQYIMTHMVPQTQPEVVPPTQPEAATVPPAKPEVVTVLPTQPVIQ